jgi:NAD-dependent SIR2 family protein deacetylase
MQAENFRRTLADVIGSLRNADGRAVVLIGAGCSKSAGIPLASGLVQEIKDRHPEAYQRASRKRGDAVGYNEAMGELSLMERRKLLGSHIDQARINWAHLALAQLLKHQKIERVLSVNFDNLLIQACGAAAFYPPVYDLAATDRYSDKRVSKQSLLYLNGQHSGFVTLNTPAELESHKAKLKAVVEGTGTQPVWLVVGYSGEADPLLEVLAAQEMFEGDLYWLGHDKDPSQKLLDSQLFAEEKAAFYVGKQDADQALTAIAQGLYCFPPEILNKPFEYIEQVVQRIDFDTGGEYAKALQQRLHQRLHDAKNKESSLGSDATSQAHSTNQAEQWLLAGQHKQVQSWYEQLTQPDDAQHDLGAWGYIMDGTALAAEAQALIAQDPSKNLPEARSLWQAAGEKYALALKIKADKHEAANNWGVALDAEAKALIAQDPSKNLPEARSLWQAAGEKYALALNIKDDKHDAANGWSVALSHEVHAIKDSAPRQAEALLNQAQDLLERNAAMSDTGAKAVSYNLACVCAMQGKAAACVAQLEVCRQAGNLPERQHLQEDKDLNPIRQSPEFQAWWRIYFLDASSPAAGAEPENP